MRRPFDELYNYDVVRAVTTATVYVGCVARPTVVLGSRQSDELVRPDVVLATPVRRRRGGGGAVLLQPGDVWLDFWIPAGDARFLPDPRRAAEACGEWWCDALRQLSPAAWRVHTGPTVADAETELACFARVGPGEVVRESRKVVGITQWRVREGTLISTLLPARSHRPLVALLRDVPESVTRALDHHSLESLGWLTRGDEVCGDVLAVQGPWDVVAHLLSP